jgi:hypothetical protein
VSTEKTFMACFRRLPGRLTILQQAEHVLGERRVERLGFLGGPGGPGVAGGPGVPIVGCGLQIGSCSGRPAAHKRAGQDAWSPNFLDYLFLAFNTSTAFSPTDMPALARWAKLLMMLRDTELPTLIAGRMP